MTSPLLIAVAVCLALGVASLATPSGPTYDPYAWLIWGRDLTHLDLVTRGTGTSWKPLPALIDALLTAFGRHADDGWLVVARAGGMFAVFMAFRLAWRVAPRPGRTAAGIIAAVSIVLTSQWFQYAGVGYSEGLMVALGLLAVDRHLDGHRAQAFALIVAAALIRVEASPFALGYGAWLWVKGARTRDRLAFAAGLLAIPVLWFGGDWIGSGRLTTAADRALSRRLPGAPGQSAHPAVAVVKEALTLLPLPVWIAIAAALLIPHARRRVTLALAACALAWTAVVAAMAQRGYPGLPRFLFMATGLEAAIAGIGAGCAAAALIQATASPRIRTALAGAVGAFALCTAFAAGSVSAARQLPRQASAIEHVADLNAKLANAVQKAGGRETVVRCGRPATPWFTVTALAWYLDVQPTYLHVDTTSAPLPAFQHASAPAARRSPRRRPALLRRTPSCRSRQSYSGRELQLQRQLKAASGRVRHASPG
jgi:hypothetical protein